MSPIGHRRWCAVAIDAAPLANFYVLSFCLTSSFQVLHLILGNFFFLFIACLRSGFALMPNSPKYHKLVHLSLSLTRIKESRRDKILSGRFKLLSFLFNFLWWETKCNKINLMRIVGCK
ncbi:unnamed protein product [Ilex paraguariensis]|uniref:Uncharacterized protein n=1 Tax=Ilex paraguariensis TaxID=185542 RepID=A0ABC8UA62_9AQUA